ncbi:MAG: HDOD domain-containing protein [Myxococcota bacterium]|nr:HDOD domain-containing protein [Myxococcota bacterium]
MLTLTVHNDEPIRDAVESGLNAFFETKSVLVDATDPLPDEYQESDLVILDFDVPDPLATIQQIKTRTPDSDVLLLLPTEYDFKLVSAVMRCGVSDCLVKPFDQSSLTKIVAKIKNIPDPLAEEEETQSSDADKGIDDISSFLLDQTNLPPMPATAMRVVRLCRNTDVNADQLTKVIETDQAMAAELLRTANSALYKRSVPVTNIRAAVVRIGLKNVSNLAIGLSAKALHQTATPRSQKLWQESRTIAAAAQVIAALFKLEEDAYVAGLLHNVGMTLLNNLDSDRFEQAIEMQLDGMSAEEAEKECFGVDHATLGHALALKWQIDRRLREAIGSHLAPWEKSDLSKEGLILACSINIAQIAMTLPVFDPNEAPHLTDEDRDDCIEDIAYCDAAELLKLKPHQAAEVLGRLEEIFIQDPDA